MSMACQQTSRMGASTKSKRPRGGRADTTQNMPLLFLGLGHSVLPQRRAGRAEGKVRVRRCNCTSEAVLIVLLVLIDVGGPRLDRGLWTFFWP